MSQKIKIRFLGTGTSQGVPVIACDCPVCQSANPKDKRLRTSVLIQSETTHVVIDTGPDFRQQMLNAQLKKLDAILYTHEHKDHTAGLDDVRAFNFVSQQPMEIFCTQGVKVALSKEFSYIFDPGFDYPGIPKVNSTLITKDDILQIGDLEFHPIEVMHYKLPVLGFRTGDITYITDANCIDDKEIEKVKGSKILILNALRKKKHISHFNLTEALDLIKRINPERAYLTHISHLMGKHDDVSKELPDNVFIAYDGLEIHQ